MSEHHHRLDRRRWAAARRDCFERDGYRCVECGKAGRLEAHHLVPVSERPELAYALDNLATLCPGCHIDAHGNAPSEQAQRWRAFVDELR